MSGLGFEPATVEVHNGDRVRWENLDLIVHTATAGDHSFDSGDIAADHSWTLVTQQRGTFNYACRYHPNMKGTLVVR